MIPNQHINPKVSGLIPDLISLTTFVFKPIAAIAIIIKNLLKSLNGAKKEELTPNDVVIVVIIEAKIK